MADITLDAPLLSLLPEWYREVLDYQEMMKSEQAQLLALGGEMTAVADNMFFQTMGIGAIELWERVFNIVPDPQSESLDFRRLRVLNRISTKPPFTLGFLYQKLDELIGPGEWTVTVDYPNYTLYVESAARDQSYAFEVAVTIGKIKPAHIVFVNTPYLSTGLVMSEEISLSQRVYNYRLGSWGLGVHPFALESDLGVIKMPGVLSISDKLLSDTAAFVSGDIASARLNGAIAVTSLTKSVEQNVLTVSYAVPQNEAETVTQVELLDSAGNTLTSSAVYVPVSSATVIKHRIPVLEGVDSNGG